jgi:ribosomal protein S18 acetylase RimI-like enzyme
VKQALIRVAAESDIQFISHLQRQWLEEGSVHGFVPESEQQLKTALGPYLLIAETGSGVVGFICGSIHVSKDIAVIPEGESYIEIDNLYISPEFRRQGIGSELITRLLAQAKAEGVAYALLYSAVKDVHAILRFYEQHDFHSWYVQMFRKL